MKHGSVHLEIGRVLVVVWNINLGLEFRGRVQKLDRGLEVMVCSIKQCIFKQDLDT